VFVFRERGRKKKVDLLFVVCFEGDDGENLGEEVLLFGEW